MVWGSIAIYGVMIQHWRISRLLFITDRGRGYYRGIIGCFGIKVLRREGFREQVAESYKVVFKGGPTRF